METIYQTIVKDCGCDVGAFDKKNFLITFGHKTLVTLKDFCYFIDVTPLKKKIWAGDILKIDDQEYEILRIGEIASMIIWLHFDILQSFLRKKGNVSLEVFV